MKKVGSNAKRNPERVPAGKAAFFAVTMVSVVLLNSANGVYQNSVLGLAAQLPETYTGAVILGNNCCGIFTSVVFMLSLASGFILGLSLIRVCCTRRATLPASPSSATTAAATSPASSSCSPWPVGSY